MKTISKYCIRLLLLFFIVSPLAGQEGRIKGLRIGYDLSRLPVSYLPLIDSTRKAFEISADFEVKPKYYAVFEYGQQQVNFTNDLYEYSSDGYYWRTGFDYNFLGKKLTVKQYEMVFMGLRFAHASYSHSASNLYIADNYWGDVIIENYGPINLSANWIEIAGGIRGELFKNCFIGWSFRARLMMSQKRDDTLIPYYIPGFGAGDRKARIGFNYYIYYRIPLYKVKAKEKAETEP